MPHHKSCFKRVRQNPRRTERNRSARSTFRTSLKTLTKTIAEGNAAQAAEELKSALQIIGKTAKKGLIHPNKAARHASRLTKRVRALTTKSAA
jgi:small subunit ribosomal protein S20